MFAFGNRNHVETSVKLIATAGREISEWFEHKTTLQWQHAKRWTAFCGALPAFAYVVFYETYIRQNPAPPSVRRVFFKAIDETLFAIYEQDRESYMVSIRDCLPLISERRQVCQAFGVGENTHTTMDDILGIIFPNRLRRYQADWAAGDSYLLTHGVSLAAFESSVRLSIDYAAMRLAADLTGVVTPDSLVGHSARELGIMAYPAAVYPLTMFVGAYDRECD